MKIGIDATGLYGPRTGVENYIINIINSLLTIDNENKYIIYCRDEIPKEIKHRPPNVTFKILTFYNRKIFQQTRLPVINYFDSTDLMFYPGNSISLICPCRSVLTIHDIFPFVISDYIPKYHPINFFASINTLYWKWIDKIGCLIADKLIAVSNSTKNDVAKVFSVPEDKITVIHEGVSEEFEKINNINVIKGFRKRYDINDKFILCPGTSTYKNLQGSLKAFLHVKRKQNSSLKLVIIGPKERIRDDIFRLISESNLQHEAIFLGFFPQKDLPLLYNAAELLLFPSFYEGFGIPVLEAFSCGTPVIASNVASLPEIAGDAAILVDPYNPLEIAFQLEKVLEDKSLRERMILKGLKQVCRFSWEDAARKTLKIFEQME